MLIIIAYKQKFRWYEIGPPHARPQANAAMKSFPNPSKILKKPSKTLRKSLPKSLSISNEFQTRPERVFLRFFSIFWSPRPSQNRAKIAKIRKKRYKIDIKKMYGFQRLVLSIVRCFRRPKMIPRWTVFRYFFDNVNFMKIIDFL